MSQLLGKRSKSVFFLIYIEVFRSLVLVGTILIHYIDSAREEL